MSATAGRTGGPSRKSNGLRKGSAEGLERVKHTSQALIGYTVRVQVYGALAYEGVFSGAELDASEPGITLSMARVVEGRAPAAQPDPSLPPSWRRKLTLPLREVNQLSATNVRLGADDLGGLNAADDLAGFGTDASISRGRGARAGRELQRWEPSAEDAPLEGLEDSRGVRHSSGSWDQFAVNRGKFGVQTNFQEDLYTTKLDKGKSRISEAEAARLAAEIMGEARTGGAATVNAHVAEERGMEVDDGTMDEEDKYSSVLRPPPSTPATPIPISNGSSMGAWSSAGNSLAAITGRSGVPASAPRPMGTPTSGPRPIPGRSAAIDMPAVSPVDTRREHNKVAMHIGASSRKDRAATSPYGTPKGGRSPLSSPLVHNAAALEAMNLTPGVARVDKQTRAAFEEFKAREAADKAKRERDELKERLRTFSVDSGGVRGPSSTGTSDIMSPPEQPTPLADAAGAASPSASTTGNSSSSQLQAMATKQQNGGGKQDGSATDANPKPPLTPSSATSASSKLNPFAKSFAFNPGAKEFKPVTAGSGGGGQSLSSASVPAVPASARPRGVAVGGPSGGRPPHGAGGNSLSRQTAPLPRVGINHSRSGSGSGPPLSPGGMMPGGMAHHQRMGSGGGPPVGMGPPFGPPPDGSHGMGPPQMERAGSGPRPGMHPGMQMQGGVPVQMPQGVMFPPQQPGMQPGVFMHSQPVMMGPGSPGQFMYPRPPGPYVMSPYGPMVMYPSGPGSPGGPPPAGMPPQMYGSARPPFPPGQMGPPPPGAHMMPHPGHPGQMPHHGHSHSRSSSFGGGGPPDGSGGLPSGLQPGGPGPQQQGPPGHHQLPQHGPPR